MGVTSVLTRKATGTYVVTRTPVGTYPSGGLHVPGTPANINVLACVQPLTPRELERLPEGLRSRELRHVWTAAALKVADGVNVPDLVAIDGASWEVQAVEDWVAFGGLCKAVVARV